MSINWNSVPKQQKVTEINRLGQGSHSEQKSRQVAWWTWRKAEKPLSVSIQSLPVKVKSQGECQPMHRQMNAGALLWSLSDWEQAIIKSLWWQSSLLKETNKNKYIKNNKSQGPVIDTHYPWGITRLFSLWLSAIRSWILPHCFNSASITLHHEKPLFLCTSGWQEHNLFNH